MKVYVLYTVCPFEGQKISSVFDALEPLEIMLNSLGYVKTTKPANNLPPNKIWYRSTDRDLDPVRVVELEINTLYNNV